MILSDEALPHPQARVAVHCSFPNTCRLLQMMKIPSRGTKFQSETPYNPPLFLQSKSLSFREPLFISTPCLLSGNPLIPNDAQIRTGLDNAIMRKHPDSLKSLY